MTKPSPDGFHSLNLHIVVTDGAQAVEFYKKGVRGAGTVSAPVARWQDRDARPIEDRRFHPLARR